MTELRAATAPSRRARSRRAAANDIRLRTAASSCVVQRGWDSVSFLGVAQEAGLTTRPMYDRFSDISAIGVDLWRNEAGPELGRVMDTLFGAALDRVDLDEAVAAIEPFVRPGDALAVAAELLAAAPYDEQLAVAIRQTGLTTAIARCQPTGDRTPSQAAQAAYLMVVALGLLMIRTRPLAATVDVRADLAELLQAFGEPGPIVELPMVDAPHMRRFVADDPDPRVESILTATLMAIAERGYTGATTEYIADCAGVSQGSLFARYASKLQLFIAATRRQQAAAFRANYRLTKQLTAQVGPGRAEATMMREWLRPEHQPGRALILEQLRLSWHDEIMRAAIEDLETTFMAEVGPHESAAHQHRMADHLHFSLALGQGCNVVGILVPGAWQLPMSVVKIPLMEPSAS
ncbi:MAG: helix-turn-helix domain-containing protein [Actinomycetales bacterium]